MKHFICSIFIIFGCLGIARADVASVSYVEGIVSSKVDSQASATQTMAGTYDVTGSLQVPDTNLPAATN